MGTFKFEVMPFGLLNAPSTFQRMMQELVGHLAYVGFYLDDVVIFLETLEDHISHFHEAVQIVSRHSFNVKVSKFDSAKKKIFLFGHIVRQRGVEVDPRKVKVIQDNFKWTAKMNGSFQIRKEALTQPPMLAFPEFEKRLIIEA